MNDFGNAFYARTILVSCAAMALASCGTSGSYRLASVGNVPGDGATAGGAGSGSGADVAAGPGSNSGSGAGAGAGSGSGGGTSTTASSSAVPVVGPVLVSAGNAVIGVSGKHDALAGTVGGIVPGATPVTGTVTAVLRKTGQTLVDVGGGQSVVLNKAGGTLGEVVSIDLGSRKVVSAATGSSLLGVGVASATPPTGSLASVNLASGTLGSGGLGSGGLGSGAVADGVVPVVTGVVHGVVNTVATNAPVSPTGVVGSVLPTVQGATAPLTGVGAQLGVVAAGSGSASANGTSVGGSGLLGVGGLLGGKTGH